MRRPPTVRPLSADPYLKQYREALQGRAAETRRVEARLTGGARSLADFASAHEYYGLHGTPAGGWVFREFAPNATALWLVGDFSGWRREDAYRARRVSDEGVWEWRGAASALRHEQYYHLEMEWPGGGGTRLPAYVRRVVQDRESRVFAAQVWEPKPYAWRNPFRVPDGYVPLVYEAHVGMAQEREGVGTYAEFRDNILPRVKKGGYNTVQLMAVMEHPYYGSFGYQVSNFFAASSRFGTPEELKSLVDAAHGMGLAVILDLVHSHAVKNPLEGLAEFDGTPYLYFHDGTRGWHSAWDSRCFDYGKTCTLHFLLSNCRFWLDEYHFDGFRFDGVTSMLYLHHGLGVDFLGYGQYFDGCVDVDAITYLALANRVIHAVRPDAVTVAEDVSGMAGVAAPAEEGGLGFDFRLAMGVPECWSRMLRMRDEDWDVGYLWYELTNHRADERSISYAECHDQAMVGGKTLFFEMADAAVYDAMDRASRSLVIERAVALHKMIRLATLLSGADGYLNFMGNEFGHPEWIDFPREGNGNSYHFARRQWSLRDDPTLRFQFLGDFDEEMMRVVAESDAMRGTVPKLLRADNAGKTLVFMRGPLLVALNFHPTESHADYGVAAPPGTYRLVLSTDNPDFGGQGRIAARQRFWALDVVRAEEKEIVPTLKLYLPARTAVVLRHEIPVR